MKNNKQKKYYKYKSYEYGLKIIEENIIKISNPKTLNDVYEISAFSKMNSEEIRSIVLFSPLRDQIIKSMKSRNAGINTPAEFYEYYLRNKQEIDLKIFNNSENINNFFNDYSKKIKDDIGIYSLSTNPLEILMWSHYSNGSRGICIGFDLNEIKDEILISEINYSKFRPIIRHTDIMDEDKIKRKLIEIYTTKSEKWSYESEYRVLFSLSGKETIRTTDGNYCLYSISPKAIKSVYLGNNMMSKNKEKIINLLKQEKYIDVEIFDTYFDENGTYEIKYNKINKSI